MKGQQNSSSFPLAKILTTPDFPIPSPVFPLQDQPSGLIPQGQQCLDVAAKFCFGKTPQHSLCTLLNTI